MESLDRRRGNNRLGRLSTKPTVQIASENYLRKDKRIRGYVGISRDGVSEAQALRNAAYGRPSTVASTDSPETSVTIFFNKESDADEVEEILKKAYYPPNTPAR